MEKKGMTCIKCGSNAAPAKLSFQGTPIDGWKCVKCGEEYFHPLQAERILTLNKLRKETLEAKLGRVRSNLILRIPKSVEEALNWKEGGRVTLRVKGARELGVTAAA